jgi:signal transduction histidine kinase
MTHKQEELTPPADAEVAYKLTENIPVGTYTIELDAAGQPYFSFCSTRWLRMLALDREAVMADPAIAFSRVHPDDLEGFVALNAFVMRNQTPFFWRGRIVVGNETRWVVIESLPRERPGRGPLWEGVMIDITREVEMQEALEKAALQYQQRLKQKLRTSLTAAGIAHEINQPLSRLLLRAQLATTDPRQAIAALEAIVGDAQAVVGIIATVKELLRSVESEQETFDLRDIIPSALLQIQWQADQSKVKVGVRRASRPVLIDGDTVQVQMALTNLIRNAIEAIHDANSPERRVTVSLATTRDEAELIVTDTGPGWSGAERDERRGPVELGELPLTSTKPGGSGLGLYMVRMVMENHAGTLTMREAPGGGAEAVLTFPRITRST